MNDGFSNRFLEKYSGRSCRDISKTVEYTYTV